MSIAKCVLEPTTWLTFLGIIFDTEARRFEVPEDKLLKLEVIVTHTPFAQAHRSHGCLIKWMGRNYPGTFQVF